MNNNILECNCIKDSAKSIMLSLLDRTDKMESDISSILLLISQGNLLNVGISSIILTVVSAENGGTNVVTITKTDGTLSTFLFKNGDKGDTGLKGDTGDNSTVNVGTTTTGNPGTNASVSNSGTTSDAIFNFIIPRGDKGETGELGIQGLQGIQGILGIQGLPGATAPHASNHADGGVDSLIGLVLSFGKWASAKLKLVLSTLGDVAWSVDDTLQVQLENNVILDLGFTNNIKVINSTSTTITKGTAVQMAGTIGNSGKITVKIYDGTKPAIGVTASDIAAGAVGVVKITGRLCGIDTTLYTELLILYIATNGSPTTTVTKYIYGVVVSSSTSGNIDINVSQNVSFYDHTHADKADLVDGKVPASELPSFVDDVIEVDTHSSLPTIGETGKIYVTKDTNFSYRWTGTSYVKISNPIDFATQSDAEGNIENTKAMSALRVFLNFIYNTINYSISTLHTTSKTVVGAVNELFDNKANSLDVTNSLNTKIDKTSVVQVTGTSTDNVMSQKAITDVLVTKADHGYTGTDTIKTLKQVDTQVQAIDFLVRSNQWYGISWDSTIANSACTRIGNMTLHATLPIQSKIRRCLLKDDGSVNYYLNSTDSTKQDNGAAAVLDGTDGQVMVEIPAHYRKFEVDGNIFRALISEFALPGFYYVPLAYRSAYEAAIDRTVSASPKLASVVNATVNFRGGNNTDTWDGTYRSLLGRPGTATSLTNFRTYARRRGSTAWNCDVYEVQKTCYWLFAIEYANLNCQLPYNAAADANGYKQGGLGDGVTNIDYSKWANLNSVNPFVPCGATNSFGNKSGYVTYTMPFEYDANGAVNYLGEYNAATAYAVGNYVSSGTALYRCILASTGNAVTNTTYFTAVTRTTTNVPSYRGLENPYGHVWSWTDGCKFRIQSVASGALSQFYVCTNPANFQDTDYTNYVLRGLLPRAEGFVKKIIVGESGENMPAEVGGSSTTYFSDYFYTSIPASGEDQRGVIFGGSANYGAYAGFGCAATYVTTPFMCTNVGSRLCYIPA